MKFCNKCGKENNQDSKFCNSCGSKFDNELTEKNLKVNDNKKNKTKTILIIVGIAILTFLVVGIVSIVLFIRPLKQGINGGIDNIKDNNDSNINDTDISTEHNNECYYTIGENTDNVDIFGKPDKVYHVNLDVINNNDLELKCEKSVVNIDNVVKLIFVRKNIEYGEGINSDIMENYDVDIYINNNLIDTKFFKYSATNDFNRFVDSNTFRVYEFNNLYFFTNYQASQCGGAYTLIIDKSGNILKTIDDFTYTFNTDNTFTVHDYGNCPVVESAGKDIIYKIEGNAIIEVK